MLFLLKRVSKESQAGECVNNVAFLATLHHYSSNSCTYDVHACSLDTFMHTLLQRCFQSLAFKPRRRPEDLPEGLDF